MRRFHTLSAHRALIRSIVHSGNHDPAHEFREFLTLILALHLFLRMGLLHCRRVDAAHLRLFDAFRSSGNLNVERRRARRNSQGQDPHLSAMRIDIIIIENKETCSEAYISSEKKNNQNVAIGIDVL